jgi:ABC-type uncharacterized transport system permease subunit
MQVKQLLKTMWKQIFLYSLNLRVKDKNIQNLLTLGKEMIRNTLKEVQ